MKGLALALFLVVACGGDDGTNNMGGPHDGSVNNGKDGSGSQSNIDAPLPFDFPCGTGSACLMSEICCTSGGTVACTAPASCPQADQIACASPGDCTGGDVCCGVDVPDGTGSFPNCGITSIGASCAAATACKTKISQSCTQTSKVQLCKSPADCQVESNNDQCCTFAGSGASLTFCTDSLTASVAGATCM